MAPKVRNQNVILGGRGSLVLRPADHIATGGEGSVYRAKNTVVKLYSDPKKMERDDMGSKIQMLSSIKHPYIVSPTGIVFNKDKKEIGYYMPFASGEPLSRVFTNDFRKRSNFTDKDVSDLVLRMREVVEEAHGHRALLADANELNWLMKYSKHGAEPRIIDVDSWQIGSWPATVIMPSIRDWQTSGFSEASDWFAWAVVTFQLYTGIHPFKGRIDGYKAGDLEGRMKARKSVFSKGVRLNRAVRDPNNIPRALYDWYVHVFEGDERTIPPSPFDKARTLGTRGHIARIVVTSKGTLKHEKLVAENVIRTFPSGAVLLKDGMVIELQSKQVICNAGTTDVEVVLMKNGYLVVIRKGKHVRYLYKANNKKHAVLLEAPHENNSVMRFENRLFVKTVKGLSELLLVDLGKPILTLGKTWQVMENSTVLYEGVAIQDALGVIYLVAPFGDESVANVRSPELDGLRVVSAKAGERFVVVIALNNKGEYKKFEFSFNENYDSYTLWSGDSDGPSVNTAILPKGVCATIVQDGEVVIYVPRNGKVNKVSDRHVATDMALDHIDGKVIYVKDESLWSMKLA